MESSRIATPLRHRGEGGVWTGEELTPPAPSPLGILALHGFTGAGADFGPVWEACEADYPVVAPDLPGHQGTSLTCSAKHLMKGCVEGLLGLVTERLPGSPVVMGYSMGGRVALHYALENPEGLGALVLIGASPGIADPKERDRRRREDEALGVWIEEQGVEAFCERWMKVPIIATQARIPAPALGAMGRRKRRNTAGGLGASLRGMGAGQATPLWDRLPEIPSPVLLVVGEEDLKYRKLAREMAGELPESRIVVVPEAGHAAHLENTPFFAAALEEFLKEVGQAS